MWLATFSKRVSLHNISNRAIFTHGAVLIAATAPLHAEYDQIGKIDPISRLCFEPLCLCPEHVDRLPSRQCHSNGRQGLLYRPM